MCLFYCFLFVFALLWHSVLPVSAKTVNSIPSYSVDDYPYQLFLKILLVLIRFIFFLLIAPLYLSLVLVLFILWVMM